MVFGYTLLDPIVVVFGTLFAIYLLSKWPVRLIGWMPAALSFYFIIPIVTLLTLWQTVTLLLAGRVIVTSGILLPSSLRPVFSFIFLAFFVSLLFAIAGGADPARAVIRALYYIGLFGLFMFSYEMGLKPDSYDIMLKGMAVTGIVLALYGLYQIFAMYTGLPLRGILRGTAKSQMAFEYGLLRVNSFASEPKRLGYVLFVCGLACLFLAKSHVKRKMLLYFAGFGTLLTSAFTFAGSYFFSVAIFGLLTAILYPSRASKYYIILVSLFSIVMVALPDLAIVDSIQDGFERRSAEVEVGLNGDRVYRQEFYAWDYLMNRPWVAFSGVGLGQYFGVLFREYGVGVGLNSFGGLQPLNSTFLELVFDLSGFAATIFYLSITLLIFKLRKASEPFLCVVLLFVTIQSLTILTAHFIIFFAGMGTARLVAKRRAKQRCKSLE